MLTRLSSALDHSRQWWKSGRFSAVGISLAVHVGILTVLAMIPLYLQQQQPDIMLETIFDEEPIQEQFSQELSAETEVAETMNVVSGGPIAAQVGGSGAPAVAQQKLESVESLQEPDLQINPGEITLPGLATLGNDLGVAQVSGEIGAVVSGYGAALSRITQELIRLMREQKVLVVWLFDESNSMKDDQREIAENFHKVYEELGIAAKQDKKLKFSEELMVTSVNGFGQSLHPLTPKPTSNIDEIKQAIDKIAVDETGDENMFDAIVRVIGEYGKMARRGDRRLVIIVVSDESPSDEVKVEDAIHSAQRAEAPVYILGREAIFGYPYSRIRWYDPVYNLPHWIEINRGPETAYPEALQFDGFHARWDSFSSGFGPYSQVRLAKETGGIFFVLPGEEDNLAGAGANEQREFDFLAMKEYQPLLLPRTEYAESRAKSRFRNTVWQIIQRLNPRTDKELNIRVHHYPINPQEFLEVGGREFGKVVRTMSLLNEAIAALQEIAPLRAEEESQRWRANYDLMLAQCLSYRVRLFQFMLTIDQHARDGRMPEKKESNEWRVGWTQKMITPDEEQFQRIKQAFKLKVNREEYLAEIDAQKEQAIALYNRVEQLHAGTPWARRAQYERDSLGFGIHFYEFFWDPRYNEFDQKKIQIPKF